MMNNIGRSLRTGSLALVIMLATSGPLAARESSTNVQQPSGATPAKAETLKSQGAESGVLTFECAIGGGGILPWNAPEESGNGFGISASLVWSDFRAGLTYGVALPDSFSQGLYHNVLAEFTWYALGAIGSSNVRPYVLAGLGVALADEPPEVRLGDPKTARWNSQTSLLGSLALGARYGLERGLYVAFEVRAYNHTFGGYNLSAGYTF